MRKKKRLQTFKIKTKNVTFLWCVLRYLHPINLNDTRLTDIKQYENELNFKDIDFPVKLKDITKFENQKSITSSK